MTVNWRIAPNHPPATVVVNNPGRYQSGRDAFIERHWGDRDKKLELAGSIRAAKAKAAADKTLTNASEGCF